jgi:glutamate dehydrogenase
MTGQQRTRLLGEMEGEVARQVLHNNREQNLALSNAVAQSGSMVNVYARYLDELEDEGNLDRALEFLPDEKALGERRSAGYGLTSPEYAVVMAYTKTLLQDELLASNVPDDPFMSEELEGYFPAPLREQLRGRIHEHLLRREIAVTALVNEMVNRGGITLAFRLEEDTGAGLPQIARAYAAARGIFGMEKLWTEIEGLDGGIEAGTHTRAFLEVRRLVERGTRWLLGKRRPPLDVEAETSRFSEGVAEITGKLPELLPEPRQNSLKERAEGLTESGIPGDLAKRIAGLEAEFCALDIVEIAESGGYDLTTTGCVYFALGERLNLGWLHGHIEGLPRQSRWQTLARSALRDDLYDRQAAITAKVLEKSTGEVGVGTWIESWIEQNRTQVGRFLRVLDEIQNTGDFDLSTLSVALRELRNLVSGV